MYTIGEISSPDEWEAVKEFVSKLNKKCGKIVLDLEEIQNAKFERYRTCKVVGRRIKFQMKKEFEFQKTIAGCEERVSSLVYANALECLMGAAIERFGVSGDINSDELEAQKHKYTSVAFFLIHNTDILHKKGYNINMIEKTFDKIYKTPAHLTNSNPYPKTINAKANNSHYKQFIDDVKKKHTLDENIRFEWCKNSKQLHDQIHILYKGHKVARIGSSGRGLFHVIEKLKCFRDGDTALHFITPEDMCKRTDKGEVTNRNKDNLLGVHVTHFGDARIRFCILDDSMSIIDKLIGIAKIRWKNEETKNKS